MTNVSPWTYAHSSFYFACLYFYRATFAGIINPLFTFLKTATIPTYYGISIAILRYIAMQISTILFIMTCSIIVIVLHDHVVAIVFVAKPPFIIFIHVTLDSLHIPVHRWRHSYRVIFCSQYLVVVLTL